MKINSRVCFTVFAFFLVGVSSAFAQKLESSEFNGLLLNDEVNARITKVFGQYSVTPTKASINLTKILYTSTDEDGKRVILSGLLAVPTDGAPKGLVVFCHGTLQSRDASPSRWKGKQDDSETETATLAFAAGGQSNPTSGSHASPGSR